jgi:hypothetical protein
MNRRNIVITTLLGFTAQLLVMYAIGVHAWSVVTVAIVLGLVTGYWFPIKVKK